MQNDLRYFRVISRVDGFELGKCFGQYYVRHPRGLIDWLDNSSDESLSPLIDEIPHDVVSRIREVLSSHRHRSHHA